MYNLDHDIVSCFHTCLVSLCFWCKRRTWRHCTASNITAAQAARLHSPSIVSSSSAQPCWAQVPPADADRALLALRQGGCRALSSPAEDGSCRFALCPSTHLLWFLPTTCSSDSPYGKHHNHIKQCNSTWENGAEMKATDLTCSAQSNEASMHGHGCPLLFLEDRV